MASRADPRGGRASNEGRRIRRYVVTGVAGGAVADILKGILSGLIVDGLEVIGVAGAVSLVKSHQVSFGVLILLLVGAGGVWLARQSGNENAGQTEQRDPGHRYTVRTLNTGSQAENLTRGADDDAHVAESNPDPTEVTAGEEAAHGPATPGDDDRTDADPQQRPQPGAEETASCPECGAVIDAGRRTCPVCFMRIDGGDDDSGGRPRQGSPESGRPAPSGQQTGGRQGGQPAASGQMGRTSGSPGGTPAESPAFGHRTTDRQGPPAAIAAVALVAGTVSVVVGPVAGILAGAVLGVGIGGWRHWRTDLA